VEEELERGVERAQAESGQAIMVDPATGEILAMANYPSVNPNNLANLNLDALRNRGFVLRSQGRMEEALETYDTVLQKGGDAIDLESAASVLAAMGRLKEAMNCMLLARDKAPMDRFETEIEQLKGMIMQKEGKE
jgi:tetratricopeptide (TPR) repeat protein